MDEPESMRIVPIQLKTQLWCLNRIMSHVLNNVGSGLNVVVVNGELKYWQHKVYLLVPVVEYLSFNVQHDVCAEFSHSSHKVHIF